MKKILSLCGVVMFVLSLHAQSKQATINFQTTDYNFGTIKETAGSVTTNFSFVNKGNIPLVITSVVTSCGCTAPMWTREPVLPGMKGTVSATFNPANRPGHFEKEITVRSNSAEGEVVLRISGDVIPREKTIEELFPVQMDSLRLKTSIVSFLNVYTGEKKTQTLEIANPGMAPVSVGFASVPPHISIKAVPEILEAKQKGVIEITFDAKQRKDWDLVTDHVLVLVNGRNDKYNKLLITANITEDFSTMSEEDKANAPHAVFDQTEFDFGTIKKGKKTNFSYKLTNTGKRDLIIHKVSSSCGCTVVNPESPVLKPGESTLLHVTFDSTGKDGVQTKTVNVITNDPEKPKHVLLVRGNIE
jgi:hypothetical protein